jgi:putative ABC transport system substrate-binding protein
MLTGLPENSPEGQSLLSAFQARLAGLGWVEGRNIKTEVRWADANFERVSSYGHELALLMPDVIVVHGSRALTAVRHWTDRIPIVFASVADPVSSGFVASLARPGGNVTGFTTFVGTPTPKLLQMLFDIAPNVKRVALMMAPGNLGLSGSSRICKVCQHRLE